LTRSSFWWIISRIIHSVHVVVYDESEVIGTTRTKIYSESRDRYFGFSSNQDRPIGRPGSYVISTAHTHFVGIEELVRCYVGALSHRIDEAVKLLRPTLNARRASP
jgi:hypothetical protein